MKNKCFINSLYFRQTHRYLIFTLLLLAILGGCGKTRNEITNKGKGIVSTAGMSGENTESNMNKEPLLDDNSEDIYSNKTRGCRGEISISKNGKTIYVHNWVKISELSDKRMKKAKKIVFCKDAGIRVDWDADYICHSWLDNAPLVKELEVEQGNPYLYAKDGMLIQRAGAGYDDDSTTTEETLMFCVPCKKGKIRIPQGVQCIFDYAFMGCSGITSVFLPASIQVVGNAAFGNMKSCISIETDNKNKFYYSKDGVLYGQPSASISQRPNIAAYPSGKTDPVYDKAPEYIEEIHEGAFLGAVHLQEVYLPSRVRVIRDAAFQNCKNLQKVVVKNKKRISFVEGNAFDDCPKLKERIKDKYEF